MKLLTNAVLRTLKVQSHWSSANDRSVPATMLSIIVNKSFNLFQYTQQKAQAQIALLILIIIQMSGIPREVLLWLQSLNLTYKVKNPKRDLANGFIIAEILSRYYTSESKEHETIKISTRSFDTGFSTQAKKANWSLLGKIFKKLQIPILDKEIEDVMTCAPEAALQLLLKVYGFLTGKPVDSSPKTADAESTPDYAKPTIFQKLKDKQLLRIRDQKKLTEKVEEIITVHNEVNQNLRLTKMERFTKPKRLVIRGDEQFKDLCDARRKKAMERIQEGEGLINESPDTKEVKIRAVGGRDLAKAKMSRRAMLTSAEDEAVVISFDAVLNDVINSVLSAKIEREYKEDIQEYKEYEDKRGLFLAKHFVDRDPSEIDQIFTIMIERADEFAKSLATNAVDFPSYANFIILMLQQMQPFTEVFTRFLGVITEIGNKLLNLDPQISELYFLEYGLPILAPLFSGNSAKCNELVIILACYVPATSNAYIRLIQAMKSHIKPLDTFMYCLAKLMTFGSVEVDEALYAVCFQHALDGFQAISPITRTKALSVLGVLGQYDFRPVLQVLGIVDKLAEDYHWENRAQIAILCANALEALNQISEAKAEDKKEMETIKEEEEKKGGETQKEEKTESRIGEEKKASEEHEEVSEIAKVTDEENYQEAEKSLFAILYKVFNEDTPIITQKVGLIYTARLLKYYKEFSKHYLQILLKVPEKVRTNVLDVNPMPGTEEEVYVLGVYTQKYRTYGAPLEWYSLHIAAELESFIRSNELKFLEQVHIQVFEACLVQEFSLEEIDEWLNIFQNLKRYFFIALCDRELCYASIQILKKFFCHPKMQAFVLENTKEVFVKTLTLLYNPDRDQECRDRNKEFLEFLHDFDENNVALRDFVYTIIKSFASIAKKPYETSNLILLMNRIVEERRGDIFQFEEGNSQNSSNIALQLTLFVLSLLFDLIIDAIRSIKSWR
eukprot:TRINITY_DN1342_c0_g1_i1.p1 TRINITY_DN1342_c0_g1~~TRINITY_DN1342_c0_g1_i1.p1  ORF type:complete len:955 (+),score=104.92 TRINITY_DN1342_c0_g1_i1:4363-7227(+)